MPRGMRRQVAKRLAALRLHQPLLGASMPQDAQETKCRWCEPVGGEAVAQLSSKTSLRARRRFGHAYPDQSLGVSDQQINPRMLKNNRFSGNVNRSFSALLVIVCIVASAYLQAGFGGPIFRRRESLVKNYSGLTLYG